MKKFTLGKRLLNINKCFCQSGNFRSQSRKKLHCKEGLLACKVDKRFAL